MARFRYEVRLLGLRVMLTPPLVVACLVFLAVVSSVINSEVGRLFTAGLEIILPLAAGILIATATANDPVAELQLTMPRTYSITILCRFMITLTWTALLTLIFCSALVGAKLVALPNQIAGWSPPLQWLASQLIWFSTLLWFATAGFCLAQLTHSITACASLLSGMWILSFWMVAVPLSIPGWVKAMLYLFLSTLTPQINYWLENRALILVVAVVLFLLSCLVLRRTEGLLKATHED